MSWASAWVHSVPWKEVAAVAPIGTATIALVAASIALRAMYVQRDIARRRAAIDFFLKTEMDEKLIDAYDEFNKALEHLDEATDIEQFAETDGYKKVRKYLDIQELFAVGIFNKMLDHRICYHLWSQVIIDARRDAARVIEYARAQPDCAKTYDQLLNLDRKWSTPPRRWQRWRDEFAPLTASATQRLARMGQTLRKR